MGDMTSAFHFDRKPAGFPSHNRELQTATTVQGMLTAQAEVAKNPAPVVPTGHQNPPTQSK
jgi:hypothetical protein